jgi:hypothetical protein
MQSCSWPLAQEQIASSVGRFPWPADPEIKSMFTVDPRALSRWEAAGRSPSASWLLHPAWSSWPGRCKMLLGRCRLKARAVRNAAAACRLFVRRLSAREVQEEFSQRPLEFMLGLARENIFGRKEAEKCCPMISLTVPGPGITGASIDGLKRTNRRLIQTVLERGPDTPCGRLRPLGYLYELDLFLITFP